MRLPAQIYQQFDADPTRAVPAEGYGGWRTVEVELAPAHTALVVMHAWDANAPGEFPGWDRAVEYRPRARRILADVFPRLLAAVRRSPLPVFHVVGGDRDYYSHLPGYQRAASLAGAAPPPVRVPTDPVHDALRRLRAERSFPGAHNAADVAAGFARLDFAPAARPVGDEGVAANSAQLAALCVAHGVNHLIYVGFALNWCLLMSPGGMVDMARHGCLCSTIREAVTAVENRETARDEREKTQALWRVAVEFGFVFGVEDFFASLPGKDSSQMSQLPTKHGD
jgi:nicotinamidase-related amidase